MTFYAPTATDPHAGSFALVSDRSAIAGGAIGIPVPDGAPLWFEHGADEPLTSDVLDWYATEMPTEQTEPARFPTFTPDPILYGPQGATFVLCESGDAYRLEWRTPTNRPARKGWQEKTQGRILPVWVARLAAAGARSYDVTGTIRAFDALTWITEQARCRGGEFRGRFPAWWRKLALRLAADWTGATLEIDPVLFGRGLVTCKTTAASAA